MGSDAHVLVVTAPDIHAAEVAGLLAGAWAHIERLEGCWSRFLPGSEVNALNRGSGAPVAVSADTFTLVSHAVAAWRLTDGRFDPTVGAALAALGYDRDFAAMSGVTAPAAAADAGPAPGPAGIDLDPERSTVTLPAGVSIDPGGIGKGLAADLVAEALLDAGASGALVNLGGDLRAAGEAPDGDGWPISLPDPVRPGRELARFALPHGAVATTSRLRRRWQTTRRPRPPPHRPHNRPSRRRNDTVAVTVVADRRLEGRGAHQGTLPRRARRRRPPPSTRTPSS